jgi:hypothetical protein
MLYGIHLPLEIRMYEKLALRRGPRDAKNNAEVGIRRTACSDL